MASLLPPPKFDRPFDPEDPRVDHLLGQAVKDALSAKAVILGFPTDEGVRRNGGRPGAAGGPAAIREQFYKLTPDARQAELFTELLRQTVDLGDLAVSADLEADQAALGKIIAPFLAKGIFIIILGGGHETAYGHFLGYVEAGLDVSILNWDAHADVRPLKDGKGHSGSSFRQALEHLSRRCKQYSVAGLQSASVAASHLQFIQDRGGSATLASALSGSSPQELTNAGQGAKYVSFDLDAVDAAFASGVSAPCVNGLSPALWLEAAHAAGQTSFVRSIDIVELNPLFDQDNRTARLAARTVWEVLSGLARRA